MSYWPLLGIALVVLGFALKLNPMLVVTAAAIVTGLLGGMDLVEVISTFGKAFNDNRIIAIVWIVLPVIGLLERYGLQQRAAAVIRGFRNATTGKLLLLYLIYRQITAAIGLHSTAGHPQTVRPLVAPMALAAAEKQHGELEEETAEKVKAYSAATDNVGLFFGEDIFFAIGSIVLIQATLSTYGYELTPLQLALWAIPSAIAAFIIHGAPPAPPRPQAGAAQMITLHWLYTLAGAMFAAFALLSALDRSNPKRFGNAAFWGLMALSLLGGDCIGDFGNGLLVLGLAGLAGFGFIGRSHPPTTSERSARPGRRSSATGCSCPR